VEAEIFCASGNYYAINLHTVCRNCNNPTYDVPGKILMHMKIYSLKHWKFMDFVRTVSCEIWDVSEPGQ
jgi:hypothetical protein